MSTAIDGGYFECCAHCLSFCRGRHTEGCPTCDDPSIALNFKGWDDPDHEDD